VRANVSDFAHDVDCVNIVGLNSWRSITFVDAFAKFIDLIGRSGFFPEDGSPRRGAVIGTGL